MALETFFVILVLLILLARLVARQKVMVLPYSGKHDICTSCRNAPGTSLVTCGQAGFSVIVCDSPWCVEHASDQLKTN